MSTTNLIIASEIKVKMKFDFKKYHYRAMNAANAEEKNAINQELKDLYAGLSEEDKKVFNQELEQFTISQFAEISSSYDSIKDTKTE